MVSVVVCDMVFVRSGAPRLYPGAPSLALRAIHLAATYGNMRYQMEPAGAVCSHQTNALRDTGMSRLRRAGRMCSSTLSVNCEYVEKWAHTVRPYGRKNLLPFSFSKRSPVSGLRQTILGKGVKIRGWKPWCLPSCAPAA